MPIISTYFCAIFPWFYDQNFLKVWYTWDWNSLTSLSFFFTFLAIPECQAPRVYSSIVNSFCQNPNWQRCYQQYTSSFDLFSLSLNINPLKNSYMFTILSTKATYLIIMMLLTIFLQRPIHLSRLLCFVNQGLCACMHWKNRFNYQYWAWCCWETSLFNVVHNQSGKNNFTSFKKTYVTGEMYCYIILNTRLSHFLL
jgi:hypothetical protein